MPKNPFKNPLRQSSRFSHAGVLPWAGWRWPSFATWWQVLSQAYAGAFAKELEQRRLFLWLPVFAGAGVLLYFAADSEPVLWLPLVLAAGAGLGAVSLRHVSRSIMLACTAFASLWIGFAAATLRGQMVAAPVLTSTRILDVSGLVEVVDWRRQGARFLLRLERADGLAASAKPYRLRLTTRYQPNFKAGDHISLKVRVQPPAEPAMPGAYDFGRDAYFLRIGGVGTVLGRARLDAPPQLTFTDQFFSTLDQWRNTLAARVDRAISLDNKASDNGAIGAAMVTGKRDLLSFDAKDLIREAGIFHIITISGMQMTLVAGIVFYLVRLLLAAIPGFALRLPIRTIAGVVAMVTAVFYDLATGSRIGTERALLMTVLVLLAAFCERRALTMRSLALVAMGIMAFEPEAVLGASFQLSFAAVAGLVAAFEARQAWYQRHNLARELADLAPSFHRTNPLQASPLAHYASFDQLSRLFAGLRALLLATLCATAATAIFMAYDFHELSPYVLIGNPATLMMIEFFAVPASLLGTLLTPLGLDGPVWHYLGFGIGYILDFAKFLASLPHASLPVPAFSVWAMVWLTLGVLNILLWRTLLMRLLGVPFLLVGVWLAFQAPRYDMVIAPDGASFAYRDTAGVLEVVAAHPNYFAIEQWLRADGDGRAAQAAVLANPPCDAMGCVVNLPNGQVVALVSDARAFAEDCRRAAIIITKLTAPAWCGEEAEEPVRVYDRVSLSQTGAVALVLGRGASSLREDTSRTLLTHRGWTPPAKAARSFETLLTATDNEGEPAPDAELNGY